MNQRQIPKGFDIFRQIFGAIAPMLHKKPFFEEQKREQCNSFNFLFVTRMM
jgi:hypothetical protein